MQQTVLDSAEFKKFAADVTRHSRRVVQRAPRRRWQAIDCRTPSPNDLIATIGDDLLARFKPVPLLDEYDVYEQLMTYWHDIMHDDVFLIMNEGWVDAAKPRKTIEDKDRKLSETPDLVVGSGRSATKYKMDLIPPRLIVARYFADEQAKIDELTAAAEEAARAVEEYIEEHAVEDGLLAEAMDDDKISKALATARLKEAKREGSDPDEIKALAAPDRALRRRGRRQEGRQGSPGRTRPRHAQEVRRPHRGRREDARARRQVARRPSRSRVDGEVNALTLDSSLGSSSSASATPRPSATSTPSWRSLKPRSQGISPTWGSSDDRLRCTAGRSAISIEMRDGSASRLRLESARSTHEVEARRLRISATIRMGIDFSDECTSPRTLIPTLDRRTATWSAATSSIMRLRRLLGNVASRSPTPCDTILTSASSSSSALEDASVRPDDFLTASSSRTSSQRSLRDATWLDSASSIQRPTLRAVNDSRAASATEQQRDRRCA